MSVTYRVNADRKTIRTTCSGAVTLAEGVEHFRDQAVHATSMYYWTSVRPILNRFGNECGATGSLESYGEALSPIRHQPMQQWTRRADRIFRGSFLV